MCGRSTLTVSEESLEKRFGATFYSDDLEKYNPLPNYNVAPTHRMPVITNQDPDRINIFRWGLIPFWAKDIKMGYRMINARIETILEKSSFKVPVQKRRCLIPMDGFYEWKREGKEKTPYRILLKSKEVFAVAGLWEQWKSPEGEIIPSFTVITQGPNQLMEGIHDRMPAILYKEQEQLWLDPELSGEEALKMIAPYDSKEMEAYIVDAKVGNVRNNDASLIEQV